MNTRIATVFTDAAKYPRHISRFPYQWSNYSQIHDYKVAKVDVILNGGSPTSNAPRTSTIAVAKLLKNADSTKYHRHILRIPYQWPNLCQIRNSQRVIAPKNRYFRLFREMYRISVQSGESKKSTATVESQNTNLIARANSSSLEDWRAVFQVIIEIFLRPTQTC